MMQAYIIVPIVKRRVLVSAMRIHISPKSYNALSKFSGYRLAERGVITVKVRSAVNILTAQMLQNN